MSIKVLRCEFCNKEGIVPFTFEFAFQKLYCAICLHSEDYKWSWHFCSLVCLFEWFITYEIQEKGVPCQTCKMTGYEGGLESNGECRTCYGTGRLVEQVVDQRAALTLDYGDNVRHCPECGTVVVLDSNTGTLMCGMHSNHYIDLPKECAKCGNESIDLKRTYDRDISDWIMICPDCRRKWNEVNFPSKKIKENQW